MTMTPPLLGDHEAFVEVAPDSTGKYIRNITVLDELPDGTLILKHMQAVVLADPRGDLISFRELTSVLGEIRDLLRDLKEIAERNWT